MRRGVDYSWNPPAPDELRRAGATFAVRYVGTSGHIKNLTFAEAVDLSRSGLDIACVYQPSDGFLIEPGRNGSLDAQRAWADAERCGMPAGHPIYFALDLDPARLRSQDWIELRRFLDQAASYLGRYRVGIYGGREAIDRAVGGGWARYGWQTRSWSTIDGQIVWSRLAGLRQIQHEVPLGSGSVDWNEAHVEDFGQWKVRAGVAPTRYPGALWRPLLGEEENEPIIRPTQVIYHTMVGFLQATEDNFDREGNPIESHFGLGSPEDAGRGGRDGEMRQWMPLNKSADANFRANRRPDGTGAISVETADGGNEFNPWSPKMLTELIKFGNWAADNLDIPRRLCRHPADPGFGYHTLFGAPSDWTPVAKTCPGPVRIRQFREIVLPAILAGRNPEEDEVTKAELIEVIPSIANAVAGALEPLLDKYSESPLFVKKAGEPDVYRVHGEHLFHVQDPEHYRAASGGEGITENVLTVADDDEVWLWPIHRA